MIIIKWILLLALFKYSQGLICGVNKECVSYSLCNNGTMIKDGGKLIDLRLNIDSKCQTTWMYVVDTVK